VVDDYEPWRRFVRLTLQIHPTCEVISEASDGLEAVQKAQELQPDLIVLDIGLPTLNGIEAARRIRTHTPQAKILFLSENRSLDIAKEALRCGGSGYVLKSDAASELALAVEVVLHGKLFVSASLARLEGDRPDPSTGYRPLANNAITLIPPPNVESARCHEVAFYSDERQFLDHLTLFIGAALKNGNAAIVAATESHRITLTPRLQAYGVDIAGAIERGRYLALDAADALSTFIVNSMPDATLFMKTFENLILTVATAADAEHPRVAIFGECVHLLCAQGNPEAAIQMEKLGNQLIRRYDVDILCSYSLDAVRSGLDEQVFQQNCAEHSAVHGRELRY
jgi:DNA-binding NarL/FixJ family response regulator/sulfur relay (sulfurtransferase) DsrF/TusC family protein